ncbi:MAG: hypothetical protein E8D41_12820 [Nitrospira sp.]|nr:MAG: hypothetical protein E8D41_12820 [Nitrospira sp.]
MSSSTTRFLFFIRSFDLKYELVKGTQAAQAHVFLGQEYQKGFQGAFKGLSRGKHQITGDLVAATHTITIDVQ